MADSKRPDTIPPTDLVPDLTRPQDGDDGEVYWIGALPGCPVVSVDLGIISFPVFTEIVRATAHGGTQRIAGAGVVRKLTKADIAMIQDRMPRIVVRWTGEKKEPMNTIPDDPHNDEEQAERAPRRGFLISIPREEDVAKARAAGRYIRTYVPEEGDEPIAKYLYMVKQGHRDNVMPATEPEMNTDALKDGYPEPVSVSGIPL